MDILAKLGLVLLLAYCSLLLLRRAGLISGAPRGTRRNTLRVVSSVSLAPNRTVHVVRAPDGKALLLGATPSQVSLLAELDAALLDAAEAAEPEQVPPTQFLRVLAARLASPQAQDPKQDA